MFERCSVARLLASAMAVILVEPAYAGTIRIENDLNRCYAQIPPSSTVTLHFVYYPGASAAAINLPFGPSCDPEPCLTLPVEADTWGAIKAVFR